MPFEPVVYRSPLRADVGELLHLSPSTPSLPLRAVTLTSHRHSRVAGVHVFELAVYGSPLREDDI